MPLAGHAFLALWNDIAPAREAEYDRWHTTEHVPERVAIAGFAGARRYVNRGRANHRYFTLYEVADMAVFDHPEYLDLVNRPTPWSESMRPDFANFLRAPCTLAASSGDGIGGALALLAFRADDVAREPVDATRASPGVVACHAGIVAGARSPIPWTAKQERTAPVRDFDRLLLIEALDRDLARDALAHVRESMKLPLLPPDFGNDVYDLAYVFPGHDAASRRKHRRAHWGPQ